MPSILNSIHDLTLPWLNEVIIGTASTTTPIDRFTITKTYQTGLSTVAIIDLFYTPSQGEYPRSVFLKMAQTGPDGAPIGMGKKEVHFYKNLMHLIGKGVVPRCYFSDISEETNHYTIVLEDISKTHDNSEWPPEHGFRQHSLALSCLAEIHSKWWDHPNLEEKVGFKRTAEDCAAYLKKAKATADDFLARKSNLFGREHIDTYYKHEKVRAAVDKRYLSGKNISLVHRDPHFWNFMFPKDMSNSIYLIDWGSYRIDTPTNDIAYYIAAFWPPDKRAKYENKLLRHYHETLVQNGVKGYSFENLADDYKLSVLSMLYLSSAKERLGLPERVWAPEFANIMLALEDLNCIEVAERVLKGYG